MLSNILKNRILSTIEECLTRIDSYNYKSFDLYDALSSLYINNIHSRLVKIIIIQINKNLPINIRPFLGIKHNIYSKVLSDVLKMNIMLKDINQNNFRTIIDNETIINRIIDTSIKIDNILVWGLPFNIISRNGSLVNNTPNVISTYYVLDSLLDYYKVNHFQHIRYIIEGSLSYILNKIGYVEKDGLLYFKYHSNNYSCIHNANVFVASLLIKASIILNKPEYLEYASNAIKFSISKQNDDGSWSYGTENYNKFIDNFHTGYLLEGLNKFYEYSKDKSVLPFLQKGFDYYVNVFFRNNLTPIYYNNSRTDIVDSQTLAQSIQTLSVLKEYHRKAESLSINLVRWALDCFYDGKGKFYFRKSKYFVNKQCYDRWSTAPILLSMAHFLKNNY